MDDGQLDRAKTKEEWLREEIRVNRTQMLSLLQWALALLAAVELNLYYIRRDVTKHLVEQHVLQSNELLPFFRWTIGTLLLTIIAFIFSYYMRRQVDRHVSYRRQLLTLDSYSGITEQIATGGYISYLHYWLFFVFPAFDMFVWFMFYAGSKLSFTLPW